jgi:hypothetical protein
MLGGAEELVRLGQLHDAADVHHGHAVADAAHNARIVCDEQVREGRPADRAGDSGSALDRGVEGRQSRGRINARLTERPFSAHSADNPCGEGSCPEQCACPEGCIRPPLSANRPRRRAVGGRSGAERRRMADRKHRRQRWRPAQPARGGSIANDAGHRRVMRKWPKRRRASWRLALVSQQRVQGSSP